MVKKIIPDKCDEFALSGLYTDRHAEIENNSSQNNERLKCDKIINDVYTKEKCESSGDETTNVEKVPKSILLNHENDNIVKKSKPNRFVSFTLDEDKEPLTSSIYYGVKSYLHHFYEPLTRTSVGDDEMIEDDFEFIVEPGRRKSTCWFCLFLILGVVPLLLGIVLMLIGHLAPLRNPVIGAQNNIEIVDEKEIDFNKSMETCQFSGLLLFCGGGIIIMLTLLMSAYEREHNYSDIRTQLSYPSLIDSNTWIRYADGFSMTDDNRIPLSQEIRAIQMEKLKN